MIHKEKNLILSNEVLDQYHQKLESIIKSKSLYLRPKLCLDDLSIETGIPIKYVKQVLREKLNSTFNHNTFLTYFHYPKDMLQRSKDQTYTG